MDRWQDSLLSLGKEIYGKGGEAERLEKNFIFIKTLVSALKENHSFIYKFEKLKTLNVLVSPDNQFRVFSWNVPLHDGSYLYYGAIQTKSKDGKLQLIPLLDKTFEIKDPEKQILQPSNWYGAQYYQMVPLSAGSYALLGWKGHTQEHSQKVIEILQFKNGKYSLGDNVFSDDTIVRKIFHYTREASMYLRYDETNLRIVFDHIVPADSSLKGNYKYYGPDLSYDMYAIKEGKLVLQSNIPFKNPERDIPDDDREPGKAVKKKKSGF